MPLSVEAGRSVSKNQEVDRNGWTAGVVKGQLKSRVNRDNVLALNGVRPILTGHG